MNSRRLVRPIDIGLLPDPANITRHCESPWCSAAPNVRFGETFQAHGAFWPHPIFRFSENRLTSPPNQGHLPAHPAPTQRGASADRHETWARDAMDATVPGAFLRSTIGTRSRTAESCGPDAPRLASSLQVSGVGPSGPTRRYPQATVTQRSWTPGRARRSLLKPLRRECRCNGLTCGSYTHVLLHSYMRPWVRLKHPAFPAPSGLPRGREKSRHNSGAMRRGIVSLCFRRSSVACNKSVAEQN
jgi:hypothetical protein